MPVFFSGTHCASPTCARVRQPPPPPKKQKKSKRRLISVFFLLSLSLPVNFRALTGKYPVSTQSKKYPTSSHPTIGTLSWSISFWCSAQDPHVLQVRAQDRHPHLRGQEKTIRRGELIKKKSPEVFHVDEEKMFDIVFLEHFSLKKNFSF